jgi:hypothetical protein
MSRERLVGRWMHLVSGGGGGGDIGQRNDEEEGEGGLTLVIANR